MSFVYIDWKLLVELMQMLWRDLVNVIELQGEFLLQKQMLSFKAILMYVW